MKKSKIYIIFRNIILTITFTSSVFHERTGNIRLTFLILLFAFFILWLNIRDRKLIKDSLLALYSFTVNLVVLLLMNYLSRYVVNYYINIYYFYVLVEACFILDKYKRILASILIIATTFIKYFRFLQSYSTSFVFLYMFFTLTVFITVAVLFNYSRILKEEKNKVDILKKELVKKNMIIKELII